MAAANGWPNAAVSLGKLYLAGKVVPKDEARGLAWLDAAAAVNVPTAAQLAVLARNQTKITNFQLIPSADPAKVKAVRYGTFDNPDIPPNFGFDPAFQAVHDAPYDDPTTLARSEKDAANLPTPNLYELSRRLAARDAPRSLTTYLVARTRMAHDAARCAEPQLTRHGYDAKSLAEQFDARPLEIRKLLRGGFDPARTRQLTDEMRAAGLPL